MRDKKILYIGNNLTKKTKYNSTLMVLSSLLRQEGFLVTVSSDKTNKLVRLIDMCFSLLKNIRKTDYVLIDTFSTINFYYALIISQLSRLFKLKYIPILHGGNLPIRLDKNPLFCDLIFKNSYKNIAPSNYLKSAFEKKGYETMFIPNIVEIENYNFKLRRSLEPKLFWVRAFKEIYNPTLAIKVLDVLKKEYPKAKLCMVGPFVDTSYTDCVKLVSELKLENSVEFTGVLLKEDWHKKSQEFDVFINTTNFDNTPVSVMEAMALGLPIVTTNVGGIPFLIDDKIDGLLVFKSNAKEMADAIITILNNTYPNLAVIARSKVERFSWDNNKDKWFKVLR
ncbi:glycosyltransferase family 4 protein [Polaribacter atrinae]|uniref:Glycosyl transferase family 1 n=1 Tax=Polaribacter atrinae TaxID=1333662 RepID=A0A176TE17_9FLAO|nr:glycosyltransferase family 4 protein [Polaribacter atrinae]OAD46122.1 glycosyl transferase family 1 [Polaribacter atrinae]